MKVNRGIIIVVCFVVVSCFETVSAKVYSLPKSIPLCPRKDDACLARAIQAALPLVAAGGIPKLGVLPIDPLRVTRLYIDQGQGPVSINLTFTNQDIIGVGDAVVTFAKGDFDEKKFRLEAQVAIPTITLIGDYVIGGRVLILPIQGVGRNNLTLPTFTATLVFTGHVIRKDNEQFVEIDNVDFDFKTSRLHIDLQNLFNGDRRLGDNMLVFLNENWQDILKELKPPIKEAFNLIFTDIIMKIYTKVPYKKIHLF